MSHIQGFWQWVIHITLPFPYLKLLYTCLYLLRNLALMHLLYFFVCLSQVSAVVNIGFDWNRFASTVPRFTDLMYIFLLILNSLKFMSIYLYELKMCMYVFCFPYMYISKQNVRFVVCVAHAFFLIRFVVVYLFKFNLLHYLEVEY